MISPAGVLFRHGLYPILDEQRLQMQSVKPGALLDAWHRLGVSHIQLRAKRLDRRAYVRWAAEIQAMAPALQLLANDFVDEALEHSALFGGVHIGQEDLQALSPAKKEALSAAMQSGFCVGLSTHNGAQLRSALAHSPPWSYLALGPCLSAAGKSDSRWPLLGEAGVAHSLEEGLDSAAAEGAGAGRANAKRRVLVFIGGISAQGLGRLQASLAHPAIRPVAAAIGAAMDVAEWQTIRQIMGKYND